MRQPSTKVKKYLTAARLGLAVQSIPLEGISFRSWEFRLSAGLTSESNIFLELGESRPDWITSLGGQAEAQFRLGNKMTLIPFLSLRFNRYHRYAVATYPQIIGGLELRSGIHRLQVEWSSAQGRLLYMSPQSRDVIYDSRTLRAMYRVRLSSPLILRLGYERERQDYGQTAPGRSMIRNAWVAELHFKVSSLLTPRLGVSWGRENAREVDYSFNRPEIMVAASFSRPGGLNMFLRYRLAWRNYITEIITDRNFGRHDRHHNLLLEIRIPLQAHLVLILKDNFKKKISSRLDVNFTDNVIASEVVFSF
ncbi:MAG: hypothetical protein AB1715_12340 [Acidobacteriota bacterium]